MDDTGFNKEGQDGLEKKHPPLSNSSNLSNPPTPGSNPPPIGNIPESPPKNWLIESILATVFCCLPFGIVGIIQASNVESKWHQGDYAGARQAAKEAAKWTKISVVAYLILIVLSIAIGVISVLAGI